MEDFNNNFNDFEFIDFAPSSSGRGSRLSHEYYVTISRHTYGKNKMYRVTFSQSVSDRVISRGLKNLRIRRDKVTGDLHIIFLNTNDRQCARVTYEKKTTDRVLLNNKQLCAFFAQLADLSGDFSPIHFELSRDLSNSEQYATYQIIGQIK